MRTDLIDGNCIQYDGLLAESYAHCCRIARTRARNFYYGFRVLPQMKRNALAAIYAFMRTCDDLSDDAGIADRKAALQRWRSLLDQAFALNPNPSHTWERGEGLPPQPSPQWGEGAGGGILPAFSDTVRRYHIPAVYFHDLIDGTEMDLTIPTYSTFDDLYRYCYRVASTVGLTCVHVFGIQSPKRQRVERSPKSLADASGSDNMFGRLGENAKQYAEWNGIAFQLTNILRDVKEDAERGRVYLPVEDLQRFGFADADTFLSEGVARGVQDRRFVQLMQFEAARAEHFYEKARPLLFMVEPDSRSALWAMTTIYRGILGRIAQSGFDVISRRVSLPPAYKLAVLLRAWIQRDRVAWPPAPSVSAGQT